jgi:hypothetical protein
MKTLKTIPGQNLVLGHRGENLATRIIFSIAPWVEVYGPGTAHLLHQRKDDAEPYPVGTVQEGTQISWDVTDADTAVEGYGKYELRYYVGETMVKSSVGETFTMKALQYGSDAPDPIDGWLDHVLEKESEIYEAVNKTKANSEQAAASAGDALSFANAAGESAKNAATSEQNAKTAEANAKASENAAKASEAVALTAQQDAKASADVASDSADAARKAAEDLAEAESNAAQSEQNAVNAQTAATEAAQQAKESAKYSDTMSKTAEDFAKKAMNHVADAYLHRVKAERAAEAAAASEQAAAASAEEAKKAAENAGGGMGGADWNAAEGEPGHVLNRTHWVEGGMVEILPECVFSVDTGMEILNTPLGLMADEHYIAKLNGVEYSFVPSLVEEDGIQGVAFNLDGSHPEIPFILFQYPPEVAAQDGVCWVFEPSPDSGIELPFTLSITHVNETIHKLPGKFLPDGVPYVEEGITDLLPETEASSFTHPSFGKMWRTDVAPNLKVGETYTITYNGTPYECVCQFAPSGLINDPDAVAMGNFSVVGGANTGEPFAMLVSYALQEVDIIDLVGSGTVKVKIVGNGEIVHKLKDEYLPDTARVLVVQFTEREDGDLVSTSHTHQQIIDALWKGVPVVGSIAAFDNKKHRKTVLVSCAGRDCHVVDAFDGDKWGRAVEYDMYYVDGDQSNKTIGNELWDKYTTT